MLVPMSVPEPPRMLVALVFVVAVVVVVVVTIRAKKASVPPPELPNSGFGFGNDPDVVNPVTRAFWFVSAVMASPTSCPPPPRYVKYVSGTLPCVEPVVVGTPNFATKASLLPPP